MTYAIYVTQQVVTCYEYETEEEARKVANSGDFWTHEAELVDSEVLDMEVVKLN